MAQVTGVPILSLIKSQTLSSPDEKNFNKMTHLWRNHDLFCDLIHCLRLRRSAAGRTAAYHDSTALDADDFSCFMSKTAFNKPVDEDDGVLASQIHSFIHLFLYCQQMSKRIRRYI